MAENELPKSQCGFWKGRSCAYMIFVIQQLVEKSWEHRAKAFFTFINLKKAYNSVLREAPWMVLAKMGTLRGTIKLVKSFQHDMKAKICLEGKTVGEIKVHNWLRQGCCMAPVLFNCCTCLAVDRWLERVEGAEGVEITFKHKFDGKLFRRYTRNAHERIMPIC